jgi:hypothetical protein
MMNKWKYFNSMKWTRERKIIYPWNIQIKVSQSYHIYMSYYLKELLISSWYENFAKVRSENTVGLMLLDAFTFKWVRHGTFKFNNGVSYLRLFIISLKLQLLINLTKLKCSISLNFLQQTYLGNLTYLLLLTRNSLELLSL